MAVRREIATEQPSSANNYELSVALVQYSDAVAADGRPDDALLAFREAAAINQDQLSDDTTEVWYHRGVTAQRLGDLAMTSDATKALESYQQSLTAFKRNVELAPSTGGRANEALAIQKLAACLWSLNQREEAFAENERLVIIRAALVDDTALSTLRDHCAALEVLANVTRELRGLSAAVRIYKEAATLMQSIARKDPSARTWWGLSFLYGTIATIQLQRWNVLSWFWYRISQFRSNMKIAGILSSHGWDQPQVVSAIQGGSVPVLYARESGSDLRVNEETPREISAEVALDDFVADPNPLPPGSPDAKSLGFNADPVSDSSNDDVVISRNALCPCGSGDRYRHCHGKL